ncbi:MAG: hypothetical protein ABSD42_04215 [Candidatus Bathyarchaeia archaeon]
MKNKRMSNIEDEVNFLDFGEVKTIRNALDNCSGHLEIRDLLLEKYPVNKEFFYDTEKAFDDLPVTSKHTLRKALIDYTKQTSAPKELDNVEMLLAELECKEHVIRTTHITLSDMGENKGTTLKPMIDVSKISEPFEFDFEYCAVCDVRQYKEELTPPALNVNFLEDIAEQGSYHVISEIRESMEHKEFEQTVKEIKDALDIT